MKNNLTVSHGNKKLISTDKVQFLIFNLPAMKTCPNSTAMCRKACYARAAERYPSCYASRQHNYDMTLLDSFVPDMIELISKELTKAKKVGKKILFRWHESGDVYSQEYMNKIVYIARAFEFANIVFQLYTKSIDFVPYKRPINLHVTFSLWDDTASADYHKALTLHTQVYYAVPVFDSSIPLAIRCRCTDCGTCQKCYNDQHDTIVCEVH